MSDTPGSVGWWSAFLVSAGVAIAWVVQLVNSGRRYGALEQSNAAGHRRIDELNSRVDREIGGIASRLDRQDARLESIQNTLLNMARDSGRGNQ